MSLKSFLAFSFLAFQCQIIPLHTSAAEKAEMNRSSDFFTAECLESFDASGLPETIASVLKRAESEIPSATRVFKASASEAEAALKRIELANGLEKSVRADLAAATKERVIFAWQGAEELRLILDYFKEEEKRLDARKRLPPPIALSVRDFGAVGDGIADDGPAIQRALDSAASKGVPTLVRIPAGTYLIGNHHDARGPAYLVENPLPQGGPLPAEGAQVFESRKKTHLLLRNVKNLTVEGEGRVLLRFLDPVAIAFRVLGGENVALKNVSIDYVESPFTQGSIIAVDNGTGVLSIKIDPGYPAPDEERFLKAPERRLTPHDSRGRFELTTYRIGKVEATGGGVFKIHPYAKSSAGAWNPKDVGAKADIIARYDPFEYDAYAVDMRYCKFCEIENVTVHSSPAGAFRNMLTYAVSLIGNKVEPPAKSSRIISSNADGCQVRGLIGPFIKNCSFERLEDDGVNLNSSTPEAENVSDDGLSMSPALRGGALFVNSITGQVHAIARLAAGRSATPLSKLIRTRANLKWKELTHEEKLGMGFYNGKNPDFMLRPDRIATIPGTCVASVLSNCVFRDIRGLGAQVTAPCALIENCEFSGNSGSAMHINAMIGWGMLYNTHDVTVRDCVFKDFRRTAVSCGYHPLGQDRVLPSRQLRNLRFERDLFEQDAKEALQLRNCDGVSLIDCVFAKNAASPFAIRVDNSEDVSGSGNIFVYPGATAANAFLPASLAKSFQNTRFIQREPGEFVRRSRDASK